MSAVALGKFWIFMLFDYFLKELREFSAALTGAAWEIFFRIFKIFLKKNWRFFGQYHPLLPYFPPRILFFSLSPDFPILTSWGCICPRGPVGTRGAGTPSPSPNTQVRGVFVPFFLFSKCPNKLSIIDVSHKFGASWCFM